MFTISEELKNKVLSNIKPPNTINTRRLRKFLTEEEKQWFVDNDITPSQTLYILQHNLTEIPVCPICGGKIKHFEYGKRFCSTKCSCQDESVLQKRKETNLKLYGAENPFGSKEIQDKIAETNIIKYGCANPSQNKDIQDKIKQTNINRYGAENPFGSKEIQDKIAATNLEKYGAENPFGSKEIQEKIRDTNNMPASPF